jgi:hypothetical protein
MGWKLVALAMGGCYGWRSKRAKSWLAPNGEYQRVPGPIDDLKYCNNRTVYILLDNNSATNPDVQRARIELIVELNKPERNCTLLICDLPVVDDVNGPDDYIAVCGDTAMAEVFNQAFSPARKSANKPVPFTKEEAAALTNKHLATCRAWILRFVVLSEAQATVLAFWLLHSWAFDAAVTTPYIHVRSPEKESGKTTLLKVLKAVARSPRFSSSISPAALARAVGKDRPTLFLDELDAQLKGDRERAQDIRCVLDSGFEAEGTYTRCVGKNFDVVDFPTFSPKVLAGIGELWDTVESRAIRIEMCRRIPSEVVEPFRHRRIQKAAEPITQDLQNWLNGGVVDLLQQIEVDDVQGLGDRQMDISEPLLQIALLAANEWPARLIVALRTVFRHGSYEDDGSTSVLLLSDIWDIFTKCKEDQIPSKELVATLCEIEGRPWAEWSRGQGLSPNSLALLLKKYRIHPTNIWVGAKTPKGYRRTDFEDSWERYCPLPPVSNATPPQPASPLNETPYSNRHTSPGVADEKSGSNPHEHRGVAGVAVRSGGYENPGRSEPANPAADSLSGQGPHFDAEDAEDELRL